MIKGFCMARRLKQLSINLLKNGIFSFVRVRSVASYLNVFKIPNHSVRIHFCGPV